MILILSSVYVLAQSGFVTRCCPMDDSQLILDLLFFHIRSDCYVKTPRKCELCYIVELV